MMRTPTIKITLFFILFSLISCNQDTKPKRMPGQANELINESSPYLLQHAHNPVDWRPWNQESLDLAKKENKLIVVSIGYASCHWCHVMEEESFEDQEVAKLMNDNFISIKVDREERPDIDAVYMDAVQLMTGSGGWPLNAICLPDGRPIFGGTYFPKDKWMNSLAQLNKLYTTNPEKAIDYAANLQEGIDKKNLIELNDEDNIKLESVHKIVQEWANNFDTINGGVQGHTKFPLPNNYEFLMRYAFQINDSSLAGFVEHTLDKIALGGIYDHVEGGFSRYSVDAKWHIPHFEKMLYDNAQLIELYSQAFQLTSNPLYKKTVYESFDFLNNQLLSSEGAYFSSLDADSKNEKGELEEGAYYTYSEEEIDNHIQSDPTLFKELYQVNENGYWENGQYQLIQKQALEDFAKDKNLDINMLYSLDSSWKKDLKNLRSQRPKPRLDDKILCSWNALSIQGLVVAYKSFGDQVFLDQAINTAEFIEQKLLGSEGNLYRNYKGGKASINAYLEDYAQVTAAYIELYQVSHDEKWIQLAKQLTDYSLDHFYSEKNAQFYFTSDLDQALIHRKIEMEDNVIPASNSTMAENLFKLSLIYGNPYYKTVSQRMLRTGLELAKGYGGAYSNWLNLSLNSIGTYYEIAISGDNAFEKQEEFYKHYIPNALIIASQSDSQIPVMQERYNSGESLIYVCIEGACKLPLESEEEAYKDLNFGLY